MAKDEKFDQMPKGLEEDNKDDLDWDVDSLDLDD